ESAGKAAMSSVSPTAVHAGANHQLNPSAATQSASSTGQYPATSLPTNLNMAGFSATSESVQPTFCERRANLCPACGLAAAHCHPLTRKREELFAARDAEVDEQTAEAFEGADVALAGGRLA